jgi:hypothetical protein
MASFIIGGQDGIAPARLRSRLGSRLMAKLGSLFWSWFCLGCAQYAANGADATADATEQRGKAFPGAPTRVGTLESRRRSRRHVHRVHHDDVLIPVVLL